MQAMARDKSFYADIACRDMKGDVILLIVTFAAFCSVSDEQYFNPFPHPPPPPLLPPLLRPSAQLVFEPAATGLI
jgi:hypothetical protein